MASFAAVILAEAWVYGQVIALTGTVPGLAWVLLSFLLGLILLRIEGVYLLFEVHRQLQEGNVPTRALISGAMVLLGAVFLIVPGFLTDGVGLLMLTRPVRRTVVARVMRRLVDSPIAKERDASDVPRRPSEEVIEVVSESPATQAEAGTAGAESGGGTGADNDK